MLRIEDKGNPVRTSFDRLAKLFKLFVRFGQTVVVRTRNAVRPNARVARVHVRLRAGKHLAFLVQIQLFFVKEVRVVNRARRRGEKRNPKIGRIIRRAKVVIFFVEIDHTACNRRFFAVGQRIIFRQKIPFRVVIFRRQNVGNVRKHARVIQRLIGRVCQNINIVRVSRHIDHELRRRKFLILVFDTDA